MLQTQGAVSIHCENFWKGGGGCWWDCLSELAGDANLLLDIQYHVWTMLHFQKLFVHME